MKFVAPIDDALEPVAVMAEGLGRIPPQFETRRTGPGQRPPAVVEAHDADVVAEKRIAASLKIGGERGFSGAGRAGEGDSLALHDDRIGVQRHQSALVTENAEGRAEQIESNVARDAPGAGSNTISHPFRTR